MSELLVQAFILKLDIEEFIGFFATQIQLMLASPPNYNMFGVKARVWIMRGFVPDTPIFFKIALTGGGPDSKHGATGYYAKVSPMRIYFHGKHGTKYDDNMVFESGQLNEDITNRMENSLFGANHKLESMLKKKLKMPRCMSPKGIKLFKYKAPRKKKNATKSR